MKRLLTNLLLVAWLLIGQSLAAQNVVTHSLTAWTTGQHTLWDGQTTTYWGFGKGFLGDPTFPAPILYANEGDSVVVKMRNQSQGAPHTIHWHGLDVNQANDGVPATSFVFPHLMDSTYNFRVPHAGTYLYHCHVASLIHVQLGMYGNFIVRPADGSNRAWTNGPAFHMERNWLMSEFDKGWHDNPPKHSLLDSVYAVFGVRDFEPNYFMVNGNSHQQLVDSSTAIYGQGFMKIYLRLSNVGFTLNKIHFPASLHAEVLSSDGRPLPQALVQDTLTLAPGERYGVMLNPITEFVDSVRVTYLNINNMVPYDTQWVPVDINGFVSTDPPVEPQPILHVFPNPSMGEFHLSWHAFPEGEGTVRIFDVNGKTVGNFKHKFAYAGSHFFDATGITPGLYILKVRIGEKQLSQKLIIH